MIAIDDKGCMAKEKPMTQRVLILIMVFVLLSVAPSSVPAGTGDTFPTAPMQNGGKKWRCAYYEGGSYPDYQIIFSATINGLVKLGWVQPLTFPEYLPDHQSFWQWFTTTVKSDYLEFLPDAFYTSDFKMEMRDIVKPRFLERLRDRKDIDFIFAMGTWAGQDLANNDHQVATMVASSSNPIAARVIASAEDSGWDHLHAKVDPDRYERQVRLFYDMVGFKKLGIVYENSSEGRTFAAIDAVEKVAQERQFEIVPCEAPFSNVPKSIARKKIVECYKDIAPLVDAFYITVHRGVTLANLANIMQPINERKLPTFSMKGADEVQHGVLMSISQANFKDAGEFHAEVMAKILNGATPRTINQIWQAPPKIALNLKEAQIIGFDPPVDVLMASDEIFESIAVSEEEK